MIEALVLAAQTMAAPMPPQDWSTLPPLPYTRDIDGDPTLSNFVAAEVRAGRCAAASAAGTAWVLKVDVAVLLGTDGQPRRTVPRAIACPAVEQYAAGLVSSLVRGKAAAQTGDALVQSDAWYRASLTFSWPT